MPTKSEFPCVADGDRSFLELNRASNLVSGPEVGLVLCTQESSAGRKARRNVARRIKVQSRIC